MIFSKNKNVIPAAMSPVFRRRKNKLFGDANARVKFKMMEKIPESNVILKKVFGQIQA